MGCPHFPEPFFDYYRPDYSGWNNEIANEMQEYQLLIVAGDAWDIGNILSLNIYLESIMISTEGKD